MPLKKSLGALLKQDYDAVIYEIKSAGDEPEETIYLNLLGLGAETVVK